MATYGRRQAIRDKCIDCCGGFVREVKRCSAYNCPLWRFRMGTEIKDASLDESMDIDDCNPGSEPEECIDE